MLIKTISHLRGHAIRFGGISADWLAYVASDTLTPPCKWARPEGGTFTAGGQCPFSTGALDSLLDFVGSAGIELLFDLNELVGRNCSQQGHKATQKPEWCGDEPAPWDTKPVLALLQHIAARNKTGRPVPVGFELGNELFAPQHLPRSVAVNDIDTLGGVMQQVSAGQTALVGT